MAAPENTGFDPALTGSADEGIYGIAGSLDGAALVYVPVPWEATTSYGNGTSKGPNAILQASPQLDLYCRDLDDHYLQGFYLDEAEEEISCLNNSCKPLAQAVQEELESRGNLNGRPDLVAARETVNAGSRRVNELVYQRCVELDAMGKKIALIGGDHSSPLGLIRHIGEKYQGDFSVLHIDAHLDLRHSYQGFEFSHASIMRNVMALEKAPQKLVQVGIRDFCEEECRFAADDGRISVFYDEDIKEALYRGATFASIVEAIVGELSQKVYVSFDIDGLKPDLCPHTGTPVAGGLEFDQARFLIKALVKSGREIVGFDLCEVCPNPENPQDEWDGNVGARILFLLSSWMMESGQ
ncbi:MAG: agmatinase family protein [Porticoccaceae bacterium]|nr:agmatinase family protein [Porticoccaceae bacterium]